MIAYDLADDGTVFYTNGRVVAERKPDGEERQIASSKLILKVASDKTSDCESVAVSDVFD